MKPDSLIIDTDNQRKDAVSYVTAAKQLQLTLGLATQCTGQQGLQLTLTLAMQCTGKQGLQLKLTLAMQRTGKQGGTYLGIQIWPR